MLNKVATHFISLSLVALVAAGLYHFGDAEFAGTNDLHEVLDRIYASVMSWQTGDLFGVLLLTFLAVAAFTLAMVAQAAGDTDSPATHQEENPVTGATHWPLLTAVGVAIMIIGFVSDTLTAYLGMFIVALGVFELIVLSVTDRAGRSVEENTAARDRLLLPLEIPVFALGLIAVAIVLLSRVFLAVEADVAVVVAIVVAAVVFGIGFFIYGTGNYSRHFIGTLVAFAVIGVIVAGLISVAAGEREFEQHVGPGGQHEEGLGVDSGF